MSLHGLVVLPTYHSIINSVETAHYDHYSGVAGMISKTQNTTDSFAPFIV